MSDPTNRQFEHARQPGPESIPEQVGRLRLSHLNRALADMGQAVAGIVAAVGSESKVVNSQAENRVNAPAKLLANASAEAVSEAVVATPVMPHDSGEVVSLDSARLHRAPTGAPNNTSFDHALTEQDAATAENGLASVTELVARVNDLASPSSDLIAEIAAHDHEIVNGLRKSA